MGKAPTRAQYYGVSPKKLIGESRRKIAKARALLAQVSAAWDENFQSVSFDVEQIIDSLDRLEPVLIEGVDYLNEAPE